LKRPRICGVIVNEDLESIRDSEDFVDLFEVRIDLIGGGWQELSQQLRKPWIACNRTADEGGRWEGDEKGRIRELLKAMELGVDIVDLELGTRNLGDIVGLIKKKTRCLLSFHEFSGTPTLGEMRGIIQRQVEAGGDVCKVITTARRFKDNLTVLELITEFPGARVVSFAMGQLGLVSRILCPLVGGDFVYASLEEGKESASGQITARGLRRIYDLRAKGKVG